MSCCGGFALISLLLFLEYARRPTSTGAGQFRRLRAGLLSKESAS